MLDVDGRPLRLNWKYDRTELLTDGIVHVIGLVLALIGSSVLIVIACCSNRGLEAASVVIYAIGLLVMLALSAAYNMLPVSPRKWSLRRFDHSAIYLLIAATYTPFIAQMKPDLATYGLLFGVWSIAAIGTLLKIALPGRFDRLSIGLYLLLGWSGMMAYDRLVAALPASSLWLIGAGGVVYSVGVVFHLWERLRFQNAIWHGFVLVAALLHYAAVLDCVALARA
jgi:hemolysin III